VRPMTVFLVLIAVGTGSMLAVQAGINAQLRLRTGDAIQAAMISTSVSTISLLLLTLIRRRPFAPLHQLTDGPWWIWTGGVLGAAIVTLTLVLVTRLGGAVFFGSIVLGQLLAALAIDHFGVFGVQQHAINPQRVAGAVMLVGGVILIRAF
jgi:bacterial/archaeal transporter family-2 protein